MYKDIFTEYDKLYLFLFRLGSKYACIDDCSKFKIFRFYTDDSIFKLGNLLDDKSLYNKTTNGGLQN